MVSDNRRSGSSGPPDGGCVGNYRTHTINFSLLCDLDHSHSPPLTKNGAPGFLLGKRVVEAPVWAPRDPDSDASATLPRRIEPNRRTRLGENRAHVDTPGRGPSDHRRPAGPGAAAAGAGEPDPDHPGGPAVT